MKKKTANKRQRGPNGNQQQITRGHELLAKRVFVVKATAKRFCVVACFLRFIFNLIDFFHIRVK